MVCEMQKVSRNDLMSLSSLKLSEMVKILFLKEMAGEQLPESPTSLPLQLCPWGAVPFCSSVCRFSAEFHHFYSWRSNPHSHPSHFRSLLPQMLRLSQPLYVVTFSEKLFGFPYAFMKIQMKYLSYLTSAFTWIRWKLNFRNISDPPKCSNQSCAPPSFVSGW